MTHITNYTRGEARSCGARLGQAWRCEARLQGEIPALYSIFTYYTQGRARRGLAVRGWVWRGMAWRGKDSRSFAPALYSIFTNLSQIILWRGLARLCGARLGPVWLGRAWQGHRASKPCALCVKSDLHGKKGKN